MYSIELHQGINEMMNLLRKLGLWHLRDKPTVRETRIKWFYSIYYSLLTISLISGAIKSENADDTVFLFLSSVISVVKLVEILHLIWRQNEIFEFLKTNCAYAVDDKVELNAVNGKLNSFMKITKVFLLAAAFIGINATLAFLFISSERKLFLNIGFPWDYNHNEIAFWTAFVFMFTCLLRQCCQYSARYLLL